MYTPLLCSEFNISPEIGSAKDAILCLVPSLIHIAIFVFHTLTLKKKSYIHKYWVGQTVV